MRRNARSWQFSVGDSVQQANKVACLFIFYVVTRETRAHKEFTTKTVPKLIKMKRNNTISKKVSKKHLCYCLYCVFWRLSVKRENNFGGKSSQKRPLEIVRSFEHSYSTVIFNIPATSHKHNASTLRSFELFESACCELFKK